MTRPQPEPIAIVGLAAIMPDAPDVTTFWANLRSGRYSVADLPPGRWDPSLYYDPDPQAPDRTYSRIGGWVRDFPWDPIGWRLPVPPKVAEQMDVGQRWAVSAARAALTDAGWPAWDVDPERVAVVLGNAIGGEKHYATNMRIELPEVLRDLRDAPSFAALPEQVRAAVLDETSKQFLSRHAEITEDTMPGELANVMAGRIANLFDLRGPNFTTDAACASALAAVWSAVQGLSSHQYDAAVTGGVDRNMGVAAFVKFCKIGALSATGSRPFDAAADGFVMGEGAGLFVLKRLSDAERAGDRIYAVLLGIGASSDGRGKGITAPNPRGQRLAVERAWQQAGVDPATATMVEAHGTSTSVGDAAELASLSEVFGAGGLAPGSIALGSVKSNIGHLKAAAGAAGLVKLAMSLHDKLLVPSLNVRELNPKVDWARAPFRVNTELRDWPAPRDGIRRGAVSAFGFGGTNFHAVLEEYLPGRGVPSSSTFAGAEIGTGRAATAAPVPARGAVLVAGDSDPDVLARLEVIRAQAAAGTVPPHFRPEPSLAGAAVRVAIDYGDAAELAGKAERAIKAIGSASAAGLRMLRAQGVFVGRGPAPKVAFLYTGQGSQYVNMLEQLRGSEPIVRQTFDEADEIMTPLLGRPLSSYIFGDTNDPGAAARLEQQLLQTEITQPAVLTSDLALTRLLAVHHVHPDLVMGHSLGEYGALVAAGALDFGSALEAVSARGHEMASLSVADNGAMAAVFGPLPEIERIVADAAGYVVVANVNSTRQAVVGGATEAVEAIIETFRDAGMTATRIPVSHAFHTSIVAPAGEPLKRALRRLDVRTPRLPIVANVTGEFYPADAGVETMLDLLGRQVASPVQFVRGLHTLYGAGARVFVEVGPKKALHGFVEDVLGSAHDDVLALFTNHPKLGDAVSFNQALCGLWAAGLGLGTSAPAGAAPLAGAPDCAAAVATAPDATAGSRVTVATTAPAGTAGAASRPSLEDAPVVVTGAALGLPGVPHVFDDANISRILAGEQFIEAIPQRFRQEMVDRRITRLVKPDGGDPTFVPIDDTADVIKLAGRHAPLDLVADFGVDEARDAALDDATRLAIGAGIDALRDAGIPLVMRYRTTTLGTSLPVGWGLADAMRDDTGVIFASAFPGLGAFAHDLRRYGEDQARRHELDTLRSIRAGLGADGAVRADVGRRIAELEQRVTDEPFEFDRRFLFRVLPMGHSQFAELIGARGPNTAVNAACASTTQAMCLAEDWIRTGRCRRVIVVSGDDVTNDDLLPWIGSGFLATGAAATDERVADAAIPFDARRHGMIVGTGAAAVVVESAASAAERGIRPICEIVAAVTANSAFHGTRLDVGHVADTMEQLLRRAESRGVDRHRIAARTVFVSHETYTPARGGSASAEINALRSAFGPSAEQIVIANTKGFTGHAMGAGIEDVVAIKSLETGVVPPVPNFREADPELGPLNLSTGGDYPVEYALRLAAGFGSQIAMTVLRRAPGAPASRPSADRLGFTDRITDRDAWQRWLATLSGRADAELEVVQRRLRVVDRGPAPAAEAPAAAPDAGTAPAAPAADTTPAPEAAPAPAADTTPAPEPAPAPAPTREDVTTAVIDIVADLTGYPPGLLDPDLDLEADLGVDTVKQAEVFAAVRTRFHIPRDETLQLRDFPTLTHVTSWITSKLPTPTRAAPAPEPQPFPDDARFVRRVPAPALRAPVESWAPSGVTLGAASRVAVMLDAGAVGEQLLALLRGRGVTPLVLPNAAPAEQLEASIGAWLAGGPVDGIYWLPALDDEGPIDRLDLAAWHEALRVRVKNLYTVVRAAYEHAPFLVAGTRHGGYAGHDAPGATAPLGGAVGGFVKAYHRERPDALVKVVDFPLELAAHEVAALLVAETVHDPGCVEVGHAADGTRWTIALREQPFADGTSGMRLGHDTVFLVTGAAGGIVSAITADLAAASGGTFHLLDLTPAPDPSDPDLGRLTTDRDGLKRDLAARLQQAGGRPTPVAIEQELGRLERSAAALAAITAIRAAGGTAHYHSVDLTDPSAVAAVLAEVRGSTGHVDVLLHAAGLEISKSLPGKSAAEFDLVFGVKTDGWFNLVHAAGDLPIGAVVAFSSVAGRFGNAGQTDYSAANELLCRLTSNLRRTRPTLRGIAVDWTAWAGIGMATRGSIPRIMEQAGVEMLDPRVGVPWVRHELTGSGQRGEVVVAGELGLLAAPPRTPGALDRAATAGCGPMIGAVDPSADGLVVRTLLDPTEQPFLNDHRIDGTAVLPGVMGIEAFAEAARLFAPRWRVAAVEDVDFLAPLKFYRDEPRELTIRASARRDGLDLLVRCALEGERTLVGASAAQRTTHFTGTVRLSAAAAPSELAEQIAEPAASIGPDEVYRVYFHGPAYRVVAAQWAAGQASVARLHADLPAAHTGAGPTLAAPRLIELCFQTAGLREAATHGRLALPAHVDRVRFAAAPRSGVLHAVAREAAGGYDCVVQDAAGHVVLTVEGYRTVALPEPVPEQFRRALTALPADRDPG